MRTKLSVFLLIVIFSCTGADKKIVSSIERECELSYTQDKDGIGTDIYSYSVDPAKSYMVGQKAKAIIDKTLDILPFKTIENKVSFGSNTYDQYDWETPKCKVTMSVERENGRHTLKIWILNK